MIDCLSPLLRHFPLNVGPVRPLPLSTPVTPEANALRPQGWLYLLLRGPLQITPGSTLLQPALVWRPTPGPHTLRPLSDQGTTLLAAPVHFGDPTLNPLIGALPTETVVAHREMPHAMATTWALLVGEFEAADLAHGEMLVHLAEVLLRLLLRGAVEQARGQAGLLGALSDGRLQRVLNAMHTHPGIPWTLQSLAAEAGCSRTALAAQFRAAVGVPPGDYLTDWRLRVARMRLAEGWPVNAVAQAVGYTSPAALTRVCSQRLGAPPSHWLPRLPAPQGAG
jgi:AraC-like DNA-binding protein